MTDRNVILKHILDTDLAETCLKYQTIKAPKYYVEELRGMLWEWLCEYDIEKLSDAYENKHLNALITRWLQNQYYSNNSLFYKRYVRWDRSEVELKNAEDDDEE